MNNPLTLTAGVDVQTPRPALYTIVRGETAELLVRLSNGGAPFLPPAGAQASFLYQSPEMAAENRWYSAPAEIAGDCIRVTFSAGMDSGAESYSCFFAVTLPDDAGTLYRAPATLTVAPGPGTPNAVPLPVQTLDFAKIEVLNAPWATAGELASVDAVAKGAAEAASAAGASAAVAMSSADTAQYTAIHAADASSAAIGQIGAHVARTDNPHGVSAAQVGAVSTKDGGKLEGTVSCAPYAPAGAISTAYDGEILATGNVIHLTTPDSSDSPCAYASGLVSGITANSVCQLMVVIENTGTAAQTFTLMNDDRVTFKNSSGGEGYVPCSELAPGAFCFVNLLIWKRSPKTLAFVRGYYRTDNLNNSGMMSPVLFSFGGKAYRLEVDENGGLSTTLAG